VGNRYRGGTRGSEGKHRGAMIIPPPYLVDLPHFIGFRLDRIGLFRLRPVIQGEGQDLRGPLLIQFRYE
jgi:hypothetical protein